jgi:hypothetical protein
MSFCFSARLDNNNGTMPIENQEATRCTTCWAISAYLAEDAMNSKIRAQKAAATEAARLVVAARRASNKIAVRRRSCTEAASSKEKRRGTTGRPTEGGHGIPGRDPARLNKFEHADK